MQIKPLVLTLCLALATPVAAETFVVPFSDIRQEIDTSSGDPDAIIRAYLAGLIRDELDAQGFSSDGGLIFGEIPLDEITERIADNCYIPTPYKVHTDATTATVTIADTSSVTVGLENIRSIDVLFDLTGLFKTTADAWVRWGQDVPFVGSCKTISTDNGWVRLDMPFVIDVDVHLDLDPTYDAQQVAIVVDKQATVTGSAQFSGGDLDHDFGTASPTDLVLAVFEDLLLDELGANASDAFDEEIVRLNYRLDGLDEDGLPDPTIEAFNAPSTFVIETEEEDQDFIRDLLAQLGVPDIVLTMVEERGVEILLQLVVLEGEERDEYIASLGFEVACDALLGTFQVELPEVPLYTPGAQGCEVADLKAPDTGSYFADAACTNEVAFTPTEDDLDYCEAQFGLGAEDTLGDASTWLPDLNQPGDGLPTVPSRNWTTVPTSELDLGTVSLLGNNQPYMKQLHYKTIAGTGRGTGTCELEMRVYKRDIAAEGLRPLLAFHGGTWQNRRYSFRGLEAGASQFTERGFIVFAPFFRLVGEKGGNVECNGASWHEVTEDVESALAWVRENGEALGATDEPATVFGQSAGAHLSAWLAANRPADVRKALLYYGPTDMLAFLRDAEAGGPYAAYRSFGLQSLSRFFGSLQSTADLDLGQISFAGVTVEQLSTDWANLIPATVFDLAQIDPLQPSAYVARCAAATATDLTAINLAMPPAALTDCMKQDLRDFLIANSFEHQLQDEAVPLFALHGSGDVVVPYGQAVGLCSAIDGSVLSPDVIDPLTVYQCGEHSEVQIIRDADHTPDLGFCAEPLCPAGPLGSDTRIAAAAAIDASYAWVQQDPVIDTDNDGIPDDVDTDDDNDGIDDIWEIANGLDPLDATDAILDNDVDGIDNLGEFLAGTDPNDADTDGDSVLDGFDNCSSVANAEQLDADRDGLGNACDDGNDIAAFDYDADGKSDILWRNAANGNNRLLLMHGPAIAADVTINTVPNQDWQIVGGGDYNGDGSADVFWRNLANGQNWIYLMNGASIIGGGAVNAVPVAWAVAGNGDFDGDGNADILWRNSVTGQNYLYLMNGSTVTGGAGINTVPVEWSIAAVADFNGDGSADILWRHDTSGQNHMYLMDGATIIESVGVNTVPSDWLIAGSGDYNGDGSADILLRHSSTGQNWMYLMHGASIISSASVNTVSDVDWQVAGNGDYDGDGKADIFWRNSVTGQGWMYLMDGAAIGSSSATSTETGADWRVVDAD